MRPQPTSKMCFVCGRENPAGLRMQFFSDAEGRVHAHYTPHSEHQGYPGVLHGGIVSAMLDEVISRTAIARNFWCMTAELKVRFKQPVPVGEPLELVGEISESRGRLLRGHGEIRASDGTLLAEADGTFLKLPDAQAQEFQRTLGFSLDSVSAFSERM
jgi:acyl-coenzyme A thioesterase PaaI-like protein